MALNQASLVSRKWPCFDVSRQIRILKLEKKADVCGATLPFEWISKAQLALSCSLSVSLSNESLTVLTLLSSWPSYANQPENIFLQDYILFIKILLPTKFVPCAYQCATLLDLLLGK